jgi:hypothetical protein
MRIRKWVIWGVVAVFVLGVSLVVSVPDVAMGTHTYPRAETKPREFGPNGFGLIPGAVVVTYDSMPRKNKGQVTVELAPNVKAYLEGLVADGQILSVQDFIRHSIEESIKRSLSEPRVPAPKKRG